MLTIVVLGTEMFDDASQKFTTVGDCVLKLEHSLISLSKWESTHERPFLGVGEKTHDEMLDYVRAMVLDEGMANDECFNRLSKENFEEIGNHIDAKMTATWFSDLEPKVRSREVVTSELIYYWMTQFNIPFTCETWHLNRLFTLIRIANIKTAKPKKMSRSEIAKRNRELNEQRKAQMGTKG